MGYHHLALATRDMAAIHHFYEEVMGFELVKVVIAPVREGGWAKHFFYRMDGDDSRFIAFWELHDVPGTANLETNLCRAAGVPDFINHIAFDVPSLGLGLPAPLQAKTAESEETARATVMMRTWLMGKSSWR